MSLISVIKVEPLKEPYIKEIENSFESMQAEVEGCIEAVYPFHDDACFIFNNEGRIRGLKLNRAIRDDDGEILGVIAGNFIIARAPGLDCEAMRSLTDEKIEKYMRMYETPEIFVDDNGRILAYPMKSKSSFKPEFI